MEEKLFSDENIRILDGGFGTALIAEGLEIEGDPLWSARALMTAAETVSGIHKRFLQSGCDVIESNSYQATLPVLQQELRISFPEARKILQKSVTIAKKAVSEFQQENPKRPSILIAGSIGPYACVLHDGSEYTGTYVETVNPEIIVDYFLNQAKALLEAGVDLLAFESFPSMQETKLVLRALDQLPDSVKCWISYSACKDGVHTNYGEKFHDAIDAISGHPKVVAIGVNCTAPESISPLLKEASAASRGKPFIVYPNSGEKWEQGKGWDESTKSMQGSLASMVPEWVALGAKCIGGCCCITAEDTAQIAQAVSSLKN